ncbi:unnamed protein product [Zymoseptoria tritici ST99CH_1E4]|uniref:Uncharacterized protein n=1 Tax=Zymoseptoria tritici ST99CH_1E4 TaxID=1276532 RepID=A0A2H1GC36_ZYMTR|nr:unnamed protein product [Zymoseptoria tritici ST99CH_1E4]
MSLSFTPGQAAILRLNFEIFAPLFEYSLSANDDDDDDNNHADRHTTMNSTPRSFAERFAEYFLRSPPPSRVPSPTIVEFPKAHPGNTGSAATTSAARPRATSLITEALISQPPPPPTVPMAPSPRPAEMITHQSGLPLAKYLRRIAPSDRDKRLRREAKEREEEEKEEKAEAARKKKLEKKRLKAIRKMQLELDRQYAEQRLRDLEEHEPHSEESDQEMDFTRSGEPKPRKTDIQAAHHEDDAEGARIKRSDSACFTPPQHEDHRPALTERPDNQASKAKSWIPSIFRKQGATRETK